MNVLDNPEMAVPTPNDTALATEAVRALATEADAELKVRLDDGTQLNLLTGE
jgi:hypothetical protein